MAFQLLSECALAAGCQTISALEEWDDQMDRLLLPYEQANPLTNLNLVNIDAAYFMFDLVAERVVLAYAISKPSLTRRDASRIRGFPNVNASVKRVMGENAFLADKGHFVGHASGGPLDINLFPQRRELNRGWSEEGKRYRAMERYVAENTGTFFYSLPIYDDDSWVPAKLEFAILKPDNTWWIDRFSNK
ncbi:MAG: hypothetical protein RI925_1073 [Pseudomonadota bacterium]|jgi:hypothetical protein